MKTVVNVADSKYTIVMHDSGKMEALRYEESWRDVTGDNLIFNLACELMDARQVIQQLRTLHSKTGDIFDAMDNC